MEIVDQIIRRLSERVPDRDQLTNEEKPLGRLSVYQVGSDIIVGKEDNRAVKKKISQILFDKGFYYIFVQADNQQFLWKEIGKTEYISVEFMID